MRLVSLLDDQISFLVHDGSICFKVARPRPHEHSEDADDVHAEGISCGQQDDRVSCRAVMRCCSHDGSITKPE